MKSAPPSRQQFSTEPSELVVSLKYIEIGIFILLLFVTLLLSGCKEEIKPIIPEEKMIKILADLHVSEAALMSLNHKVKDSVSQVYYRQIFEIHGVADSTFYQDLAILRKNPKAVERIYEQVIAEIEQLGIEKNTELLPPKKK
ncbi:MAG: DUF4296 domain-containing protein [Bacteroidota bacterium]